MVLSMDRWKGKVAVVTGAGGGVGEAVVKQLVDQGLHVVAIDKRLDSLEKLSKKIQTKNGKLSVFATDVSEDQEVKKLFKQISEEIGLVHILVNCAGLIQQSSLVDGETEKWRKVIDVNVIGLCIMTREAVKVMRENKIDGHIVNIGSIAGHVVPNIPDTNLYPASKHAVKALTETLRQEFNHLGLKVKISSVSPGFIDTPIFSNNNFVFKQTLSVPLINPEDVADAILYVLSTPPHVQVHELIVKPLGEPY